MALWDTADLVARVRRYANRPPQDELLTDDLIYALLTEAQTEELADLAALAPTSQMGAPVLLTSADGNVTYTFGTDAEGNNIFPLATEVYAEVNGRELRACSWNSWGDFVVEGDRIRMPGNTPQTFSAGPYARFVRADAAIDADTEPTLKPPAARIILVWKTLIKFAAIGGIRDPAPFEENYAASKRQWVTAIRTQFADSAGVATEGLTTPSWWVSYGRI